MKIRPVGTALIRADRQTGIRYSHFSIHAKMRNNEYRYKELFFYHKMLQMLLAIALIVTVWQCTDAGGHYGGGGGGGGGGMCSNIRP